MSSSGMHSGLFTLHFTPICTAGEEKATTSGSMSPSTQNSAEFGDWHILLRFAVENEVLSVRPRGKIFVMESECGTSGGSEEPVAIPGLGRVPRPVKDRHATVLMRCHCHWQYSEAFRFDVCFDQLDGAIVGVKGRTLNDVIISCEGSQAYGWYIGEATVTVEGKPFTLPHRLRFVLDPYVGAQCTMCLDPVYAQGYTCTECGAVEYCSKNCQMAHMSGQHGLLCSILRRTYTQRSGKVLTETEKGTELVAWWRCLEDACYSILVDFHNSLGQPIEFFLCTLKSAQEEGLRYRFIVKEGTSPREVTHEELAEFACTVFRAVSENSISEGCTSLAAACLNYIFVFSRHIESIVESHVLYYYSYLCEDFEGTICSVEEYVTYARPMHELGVALIEFALKSPTALLFWQRVKLAKNVFINLYNVNTSCHCSKIKELVKAIPGQQRETLNLLSRVFLIMASRAPKKEGLRLLEQAEKCLRDCLPTEQDTDDEAMDAAESQHNHRSGGFDELDENLEEMEPSSLAMLYFRLATLLLLYGDTNKTREAEALKAQGDALIAKAKAASAVKGAAT
ncbi:hypothetical protein C3747_68g160 [Trypanosoma cruzi]|uniref:MYND-type domain-containing protein n=2 Tax=Trypanosoma cruzi TaxID=5693 RepID=Q4DWM6_TRYCC|nr:hypothetical protein, conserved [Trypanosoma cruzi]EAN96933.1 hypothetical protein, conserved [Trypanosoma cruzi]PWV10524.1 hypothetical protein C3747_68g160 [Trypanosoma cruzi]RNC61410.1 hypothetical protein TcCL_ESM00916 [Trypanosoma cruzi]|eukprot:XP_818784.1 hypothetical protein [Trypanosoma cruzi strain CL Brener]